MSQNTSKRAPKSTLKTGVPELELELQHRVELEKQLIETKLQLTSLRQELDDNLTKKKYFEDLYQGVVGSLSWKVTAVPRKALNTVARVRRRETIFQIEPLKIRLTSLGFTERAYADLAKIASTKRNTPIKRLAAWELAAWHANQYTDVDARKCLDFLDIAELHERDKVRLLRIAVLRAECHWILAQLTEARNVIQSALASLGPNADLYLATANLEKNESKKITYINQAVSMSALSPVALHAESSSPPYDRLVIAKPLERVSSSDKVSIIIPVYNAAETIHTSIDAMLAQTWENIEILVADDCSTDNTVQVVKRYTKQDGRVKLIQAKKNGGPYVARNLALKVATGQFVTCHDSDDWSHPEKIQRQVEHLMHNPTVIANTSQQARAQNDLTFHRRGNPGYYIQANMSSLMFRRKPVTEALGFWDAVRFGADSEFIKRLKQEFGRSSVVDLPNSLLSFQRKSDDSLTGSEKFGYHGFFMGARKEYAEAQEIFHSTTKNLYYEFPQTKRLFLVPEPMLPDREVTKGKPRKFDVVFATDLRTLKYTPTLLEDIKAIYGAGLTIGLAQINIYELNPTHKIDQKIRELLDENIARLIVFGEDIACKNIVIPHLSVLADQQLYIPNIEAGHTHIIVQNNETMLDKLLSGKQKQLEELFRGEVTFYPELSLLKQARVRNLAQTMPAIAQKSWSPKQLSKS